MPTELETSLESKRQKAFASAKALLDQADTENRAMNADEERQFDAFHAEGEDFTKRIQQRQRQMAADKILEEMAAPLKVPGVATDRREVSVEEIIRNDELDFRHFAMNETFRNGQTPRKGDFGAPSQAYVLRNLFLPADQRRRALEERALNTITDASALSAAPDGAGDIAGGYLTSETMAAAVEIAMKDFNAFRQTNAMVMTTGNGEPIQWPTVNDTGQMGERLRQNTDANEQDVAFGNITVNAWTYSSKMVKVPMQLIQDSRYDVSSLLGQLLGERISRIQALEDTGTAGAGTTAVIDGENRPQGIINAVANVGAIAQVDLAAGNTSTLTYDNLVDLEVKLDPAYRPSGSFMFNSTVLGSIKKIAPTNYRPLWLPGNIAEGTPATLLGYQYYVNQNMPPFGVTKNNGIIFGDMRKVILRDTADMGVLRLNERFAEAFQVAFLGWMRHDCRYLNAGTAPIVVLRNP